MRITADLRRVDGHINCIFLDYDDAVRDADLNTILTEAFDALPFVGWAYDCRYEDQFIVVLPISAYFNDENMRMINEVLITLAPDVSMGVRSDDC